MVPVISIPGHHVVEKIEFGSGCLRMCLRPEESGEGHFSRHSLFLLSLTHSFNQSYQSTEFEKSVDTQRTSICGLFETSVKCWVQLFSGLLLRVVWWQKIDLSVFFFLLAVSTQPFSPPHHPQHRMKYVCKHTHSFSPPCFPKPFTPCCWQLSCSKSTSIPTHNQTAGPEFWKYIRGMWYSRSSNTAGQTHI